MKSGGCQEWCSVSDARAFKSIDTLEPCTSVLQVDAARRRGRLQTGQPLFKRPRSHLLLLLCVLHQVCCRHLLGSVHALPGVSTLTNMRAGIKSEARFMIHQAEVDFAHLRCCSIGGRSISCNLQVCVCVCRFAGYDTGACKQPAPVVYTLKMLIGAAPVAFIVTGLMILLLYPISEDVRLRNKVCLDELR